MNIMALRRLIRVLKTSVLLEPILATIDLVLWLVDQVAILLSPLPAEQPGVRRMLLVRLDVFGDYIVFRNYLRYLRQQPDYAKLRITLLGNVVYRPLAESFDQDVIDEFIWVDIFKMTTRPLYRFRMVRRLRQHRYDIAFSPTYSRILVLDDFMIKASSAPVRIGCKTEFTNCKRWEAAIGDRFFTRLLDTGPTDEIILEIERNRRVLEALLEKPIALQLPTFPTNQLPAVTVPDHYIVVAPGAGFDDRIWPVEHFAEVIADLSERGGITDVVITGTASERTLAERLMALLPHQPRLHDTVGQLSLPQLIATIQKADLVIANDSGSVQLAAAVQTPCVVVAQGKSLLRWHPVPLETGIVSTHVYPDFIEENRHRLPDIAPDFQSDSPLAITDVPVKRVMEAALRLLGIKMDTLL